VTEGGQEEEEEEREGSQKRKKGAGTLYGFTVGGATALRPPPRK